MSVVSKLGFVCVIVAGTNPVHANIINATSLALADVSAAVNQATNGDTVVLPSGISVWNSTLSISKSITLQGAGTNATRIVSPVNAIILAPSADLPIRVTGIYFDLGAFSGADHSAITLMESNSSLRIDHCSFRGGSKTIWIRRQGFGVIDHCSFLNSDSEINPWQGDSLFDQGNTSWSWPIVPGTTNTMVVEDCQFTRDGAITGNPNEVLYGQTGARCIFRFNRVTQTATSRPLAAVDAHGLFRGGGYIYRGTVLYEVYGNTFQCQDTYRFFNLRGGTMVCYSNRFIKSVPGTPAIFQLKNEGVSTYGTYDSRDEITNSFFWGNTFNGSLLSGVSIESGSEPYVILGQNYFTRAPQPGDGIYPYAALSYPHPRVTAEDGLSLTNPVIEVVPTNLSFAVGQSGGTNYLTFTVQNIGAGILAGNATIDAPFTISSGTVYSLGPKEKQMFIVRYVKIPGNQTGKVVLTGGGGATVNIIAN